MKKPFTLQSLLMAAVVMSSSCALQAQQPSKNVQERVANKNGTIFFLKFDKTAPYKSDDHQKIFKDQLDLDDNTSVEKTKSETDELGMLHEKFQLFYKGLKVEHAVYSLHSKSNVVESMVGKKYDLKDFDIAPALSAGAAFEKALQSVHAEKYLWETPAEAALINYSKPEGELLILPPLNGLKISVPRLAYKFDIYATEPVSRDEIYVDAKDGSILLVDAIMKHARDNKYANQGAAAAEQSFDVLLRKPVSSLAIVGNADTRYMGTLSVTTTLSGSNYILRDLTRGNGIRTWNFHRTTGSNVTDFTDANNVWTAAEFNNANKDNGALDAHYAAGKSYDYFLNKHGRNSFDGNGALINLGVHYSNNWVNAEWDGIMMRFGDGNNTSYDMFTAVDVVAHEFGHAVCMYTAHLINIAESGFLNEGFSDIWSACIDSYASPSTMDPAAFKEWIINEDIILTPGHEGSRSLSDPASEGQPDTYKAGPNWCPNQCDPHTNMSVLTHWFYVLTKGENGTNDLGHTYSATGIGMTKAAKIAYRLETVYLTADSNYEEAYMLGLQAAKDLYGLDSTEFIATVNAFYAVGFGNAHVADIIAPTAPINLSGTGTTSTVTNLSWTAATDNIAVTYYDIFEGTNNNYWGSVPGSTLTYVAWGLNPQFTYNFKVRARDNNGNVSPFSNTFNITMPAMTTYCTPSSSNTTIGRIGTVDFPGAGWPYSAPGTVGYEDLWTQNLTPHFTLTVASPHTYNITPTFGGSPVTSAYAIYVDLNQDGDFTDTSELIHSQVSSATVVSGSFTMPYTPITGWTRIRIMMRANSSVVPAPCAALVAGQIEDYPLLINPQPQLPGWYEVKNDTAAFDFSLYPNPADNAINVSLIGSSGEKQPYTIVNYLGQTVKSGKLDTQTIEVDGLSKGIYILKVSDNGQSVAKKFIKR